VTQVIIPAPTPPGDDSEPTGPGSPTPTTLALVLPAGAPLAGQSVTLTANVTAHSPEETPPSGTVQFRADGKNLGPAVELSDALSASTATDTLPGGAHDITAVYSGDTNFSGSESTLPLTINKACTTTSFDPPPPPRLVCRTPVRFTVKVKAVSPGGGTPAGTVQFQAGGINYGSPVKLASSTATSLPFQSLPAGPNTITAIYSGNDSYNPSSGTANLVVNQALTRTEFKSSPERSLAGAEVTFTVNVTPITPATGTPTGKVRFQVGATVRSEVPLNKGSAVFKPAAPLPAGPLIVTATYLGDAKFLASPPATLPHTVDPVPTPAASPAPGPTPTPRPEPRATAPTGAG
jgi:hypothetical protein